MRLIDGDALKDAFQNIAYDDWNQGTSTTWANAFSEAAEMVDNVPEVVAEQLEIIHCKECKWYTDDIMAYPWGVCWHHGWVGGNSGHEVFENGWCYRAERKENDPE